MIEMLEKIGLWIAAVFGLMTAISWAIQLAKKAALDTGQLLISSYFANKMAFLERMEDKFGEKDGNTNRAVRSNFN